MFIYVLKILWFLNKMFHISVSKRFKCYVSSLLLPVVLGA